MFPFFDDAARYFVCCVFRTNVFVISKPAHAPFVFYFSDVVNKLPTCGVTVILNPTVSDVHGFYAAVFGKVKLFAVLGFLVGLSQV